LGLSLVRQTVEAHGGTISVKSELGKGSQFCIQLPVVNYQKSKSKLIIDNLQP